MARSIHMQHPAPKNIKKLVDRFGTAKFNILRFSSHLWNQYHVELLHFTMLEEVLYYTGHLSMIFSPSLYVGYLKESLSFSIVMCMDFPMNMQYLYVPYEDGRYLYTSITLYTSLILYYLPV